jgi:hypothetical protein
VDTGRDEDPFAGRAALARVQEAGGKRPRHRGIDVGVVENDERPVAAHLEEKILAGRSGGNGSSGLDRADKADRRGSRIDGDLVTDRRPGPGDHVEDARREIRFGDRLRHHRGAQRG